MIESKSQFFGVGLQLKVVEVAGREYMIRELTGKGSSELQEFVQGGNVSNDFFAQVIVRSVCDGDGGLLFDESDVSVVNESLPFRVMSELSGHIMALSGMDQESIEDAEGN